jgi:hypothetical protein
VSSPRCRARASSFHRERPTAKPTNPSTPAARRSHCSTRSSDSPRPNTTHETSSRPPVRHTPAGEAALATLAIFTLLGSWNDLIWPLVAITDEKSFTLQLGLANFQGTRRTQWQLLMAGNVIATLPLLIGFIAAQRQFVATMTFTGMKG